jgi:predicted dehydrogenase
MSTSTPLRVGLLGYGVGGAVFHAPLIAATEGLVLDAVVTADPQRQAQAHARYPGAAIISSADELWERKLDLAVVTTPNRTHTPLAKAAIDHGLDVVVDKPLAPTSAEGRELVETARRRGVLLTVFQNRRWDADFRTVQRLVMTGELGAVHRFESRFERWRPTPKPGWREKGGAHEAGGLLNDLGSHLIDQAIRLFGPVADVYAELDRRRTGVEVDDDTFVALRHENGVRSHLWMSALAGQLGPRFRVLGEKGAYVKYGMDPQEDALRAGAGPGNLGWGEEPKEHWGRLGIGSDAQPVPTETGAYEDFYAELVRAMSTGGAPPVDPADAVAVLDVLEAARASAG